jgi:hypothetical protein
MRQKLTNALRNRWITNGLRVALLLVAALCAYFLLAVLFVSFKDGSP